MNLHGPVRAAEFEGTARVNISLDSWKEGKVAPTTHEIVVLPPKKGRKSEPVTDRLVRTLPHPDRKATLGVVHYLGEGGRLMMAGYPSGIVQVWDSKSWKEVSRMDTPSGLRSTWVYAVPTPDGKTILVHNRTRKLIREEKASKVAERLQIDGRVNLYDASTGKLRDTVPFADRGPTQLFVVPGGKFALVNTEGSFTADQRMRPQFLEMVDLTHRSAKKLFDTSAAPTFTPDGKSAFLSKFKFQPNGNANASLVKCDLATWKVEATLEPADGQTFFDNATMSPDGKWVVAAHRKLKPASVSLVVHASDTLQEVGRIPGSKDPERTVYFETPLFTPNGKLMVTRCGGPLILWDMEARKIVRTVPVGEFQFGRNAISPNGKQVAVLGMPKFDTKSIGRDPDPLDLPQPRLVLLDLDVPRSEPRLLILPHGTAGGMAFSPDGNTLAVGGTGGVQLIDVSRRAKK